MQLLKGDRSPGMYSLLHSPGEDELAELRAELGEHFFYINGKTVRRKAEFLAAIAAVMQFPSYFGQNWDALEDCLMDLEWLPVDRRILLYDQAQVFAEQNPTDWETAVEIFQAAVDCWRESDQPLYVLLVGDPEILRGVERL